jgi:hypothetical protein
MLAAMQTKCGNQPQDAMVCNLIPIREKSRFSRYRPTANSGADVRVCDSEKHAAKRFFASMLAKLHKIGYRS